MFCFSYKTSDKRKLMINFTERENVNKFKKMRYSTHCATYIHISHTR